MTPSRRLKIPHGQARTVAWLPDGRVALTAAFPGGNGLGLWSPDGSVVRSPAVDSVGVTFQAFSPDFRWIAYVQARQVFVRPFPGPGSPVAVSGLDASEPAWSPSGRQLYFTVPRESANRSPRTLRTLMSAELSGEAPLRVARPQVVMADFPAIAGTPLRSWDVMPDGSLVMIVRADTSAMADFNRAAIREIHVAQRALRGLRFGAAAAKPTPTP